jgi:hypothetical protein
MSSSVNKTCYVIMNICLVMYQESIESLLFEKMREIDLVNLYVVPAFVLFLLNWVDCSLAKKWDSFWGRVFFNFFFFGMIYYYVYDEKTWTSQ